MSAENFKLGYPFPMGEAQKTRYEHNGIIFSQRVGKGYSCVTSPFSLTEADFASLSQEDLYNLSPFFSEIDYRPLVKDAERIQLLRTQATTVHKDGFPYPSPDRPFTWPLNEKIPAEIQRQLDALKQFGITDVKVGLEMEFSCPEDAIRSFTHWQDVKRHAISELALRLDSVTSEHGRHILIQKMRQIEAFNAREILMYDLIEIDLRTRHILEPLFGKSRDGDGYYDGQGTLELKMKPVDPQTIIKNRKIVLLTLYDKAAQYGLDLRSHPSFHVNVSLWDNNGNLFEDKHPEFSTKGKALTQGITKAFYDGIFVLLEKKEIESGRLISFGLTANREGLLRYSSGRIEIRPTVNCNLQDPDMMLTVLFAGALYGLSDQPKKDMIPATEVFSPVIHHAKDQYKVTSHVLGNSIIHEDGSFMVPEDYIDEHVETLEYELGFKDIPPEPTYINTLGKLFFTSDYLPYIKQFFKATKIVQSAHDQLSIQFPETVKGKYEFVTPAINMHKIPPELQLRLERGEEVGEGISRTEIDQYLTVGDRIPKPARKFFIDTTKLNQALKIVSLHSKFVVQGYDLNTTRGIRSVPKSWTQFAWARYQRLVTSECLRESFSPEFFSYLCALAKEAGKSDPPANSIPVDPKEIREKLFFKIKDRDWKIETKEKWFREGWEELGLKEGKDFIRRSVRITFTDVTNRDSFIEGLTNILDGINSGLPTPYWYKNSDRSYTNGTYDIELDIEPQFLNFLKTYVQKLDRS